MNNNNDELNSYLDQKEFDLMSLCMSSQYVVSENDVLSKHYCLIDSELELFENYIVSTQWTIRNPVRGRIDLVVIKKWNDHYKHRKKCYSHNLPYYAVEYKIDDESGKYGKGHQANDFKKDVLRLSELCDFSERAFALYYYRGPIQFEGNIFDKNSSDYLFNNDPAIKNKEKLNVYFVDLFGIHELTLP